MPIRPAPFVAFEDYKATSDSMYITIQKKIPGPVHFYIKSNLGEVNQQLETFNPIILTDSIDRQSIAISHQVEDSLALRKSIRGNSFYGNPMIKAEPLELAWPFPKGKKYKIIQAYNGTFSHQTDLSKYAIDFSLAIGDTICAAQDGLVVGILQGNNKGGNHPKYRDFGNYITIYHSDGRLTQYAHISQNSALVKLGAPVKKGQAIGLAGLTGFTSGPHLHFNVIQAVIGDAISTPAFFEQIDGKDLKKGMWVEH